MAEFLRRHSLLLTSFALFLCSLQLMSLSVSNRSLARQGGRVIDSVFSPVEKTYNEIAQSVRFLWNHYFWLLSVEDERNELEKRVKELEAHNSRLMEYDSENKRLKSILHFTDKTGLSGVVANVVGRDPSNWVKSITIDRGSADGLREGLAVLDGNAVVGQTTTVTKNSARVLLLTDNSSAVDAITQTSRSEGTAEGGLGRSLLRLRYVLKLKEFDVNVGERVIASGLDGIYPKGALIGVVGKVNPVPTGLFQDIEIQPSVDVYRLENVLVLVPEAGRNLGPNESIDTLLEEPVAAAEGAEAKSAIASQEVYGPLKPTDH